MKPSRIQLSRKKDFNLQAVSLALNGLPAVKCARPGKFGNPFRVGIDGTASECVSLYAASRTGGFIGDAITALRGKNLACFCKPTEPCHADVLLKIANE